VCDAADLQIASAGGFLAPGAAPHARDSGSGVRVLPGATELALVRTAKDVNTAVVLEARGDNPRRPAAVSGAVLVEAVPFPKWADPPGTAALLQVWPEPRLAWQGIGAAKVTAAAGPEGNALSPEAEVAVAPKLERAGPDGILVIRNPDGTARVVRDAGGLQGMQTSGGFTPNPRQAVVRFRPGEQPPAVAKELAVSVFATVRSGVEPLCRVKGLEAGKSSRATGAGGSELSVSCAAGANGRLVATVHMSYDLAAVHQAGVGDDLPGTVAGATGTGNATVYGLRVTDADGKPYTLGLQSGATTSDRGGKRIGTRAQLELRAPKDGLGPPDTLTFWGSYSKAVEIPVVLKDVPLSGFKTPGR
jgi:hypothetical protein